MGVHEELRVAQPFPQRVPLPRAQHDEPDVPVFAGVHRVDDPRAGPHLEIRRPGAGDGAVVGQRPVRGLRHRFEDREVEVLAPAGGQALPPRGQHGEGAHDPAHVVGERSRHQQRRLAHHSAAEDLAPDGREDVVGGLVVAVGARLAEVGDRRHDQVREAGRELGRVQAERGQAPRFGRLDPDVGPAQEVEQAGPARIGGRVHGGAALVEVADLEERAVPGRERRHPP